MNIEENVLRLISAQSGVDVKDLAGDDDRWSLAFDSLDDIELIMALEEQFDIEIPDSYAEGLNDVRDIINYITIAVQIN